MKMDQILLKYEAGERVGTMGLGVGSIHSNVLSRVVRDGFFYYGNDTFIATKS